MARQSLCPAAGAAHLRLPRLPGQVPAQAHLLRPRVLLRPLSARVRLHRLHLGSIQVLFLDVFIVPETSVQSILNLALSVAPGCEDGATNGTGLEERDAQVMKRFENILGNSGSLSGGANDRLLPFLFSSLLSPLLRLRQHFPLLCQ